WSAILERGLGRLRCARGRRRGDGPQPPRPREMRRAGHHPDGSGRRAVAERGGGRVDRALRGSAPTPDWSPVMRPLEALPKAPLHVHREGPIRPGTLVEIAARHGAVVPHRYAFKDMAGFFADYQRVRECLQDAEDFRRIAYELCQDEAAQGVRY